MCVLRCVSVLTLRLSWVTCTRTSGLMNHRLGVSPWLSSHPFSSYPCCNGLHFIVSRATFVIKPQNLFPCCASRILIITVHSFHALASAHVLIIHPKLLTLLSSFWYLTRHNRLYRKTPLCTLPITSADVSSRHLIKSTNPRDPGDLLPTLS